MQARGQKGSHETSNSKVLNIIIIVLAVVGALAIVSLLGMWIMHQTMMGFVTGGQWNGICGNAVQVIPIVTCVRASPLIYSRQ